MTVKNERSLSNHKSTIDNLIESLDKINVSGDAQERIRRYTQVVPECDFDIEYTTSPNTTSSKRSCFQWSCANVCRAVSCCGVIRCFGSDNYYVSIQDSGLDSNALQKKTTRRQFSQKTNKLTNTCFFVELCNTYGKEDLPVLFAWTLRCLSSGARHYWEEWIPTSEDPLDRRRADMFKETMQEAFNLMRTLRIEKLKQDFLKYLKESKTPTSSETQIDVAFSPQKDLNQKESSSTSSDSDYKTPIEEDSFSFLPRASDDIQAEAAIEKVISIDNGQIEFNAEIIIHDVMTITGCQSLIAKEIAESVKKQIPQRTTREEIWAAVKLELISRNLTIQGDLDPTLIEILTEYNVGKINELPLEKVPHLVKKNTIKKNIKPK